jgi:hypothetical protein
MPPKRPPLTLTLKTCGEGYVISKKNDVKFCRKKSRSKSPKRSRSRSPTQRPEKKVRTKSRSRSPEQKSFGSDASAAAFASAAAAATAPVQKPKKKPRPSTKQYKTRIEVAVQEIKGSKESGAYGHVPPEIHKLITKLGGFDPCDEYTENGKLCFKAKENDVSKDVHCSKYCIERYIPSVSVPHFVQFNSLNVTYTAPIVMMEWRLVTSGKVRGRLIWTLGKYYFCDNTGGGVERKEDVTNDPNPLAKFYKFILNAYSVYERPGQGYDENYRRNREFALHITATYKTNDLLPPSNDVLNATQINDAVLGAAWRHGGYNFAAQPSPVTLEYGWTIDYK